MAKAERKERERVRRRNDLIEVAERLFFSRGYENVTMYDIATEAGMARATLYLYFRNKDDIYIAIALRGSKIVSQAFGETRLKGKTGLEKARSLIQAYYEFFKKYPGYYAAYNHSGMFVNESSPELDELKSIRTSSFRMVVDAFSEGVKDGSVRKDINPAMSTLIMLFSINNVLNQPPLVQMYMKNYGLSLDELFNDTLGMLLRSVENA